MIASKGEAAYKYDFEDSELVAAACEGLNPDMVFTFNNEIESSTLIQ